MAESNLEYTKVKPGETGAEYIARMPEKCPVCGDNPAKDCCPCGCHEVVSRTIKEIEDEEDVGFRGVPPWSD